MPGSIQDLINIVGVVLVWVKWIIRIDHKIGNVTKDVTVSEEIQQLLLDVEPNAVQRVSLSVVDVLRSWLGTWCCHWLAPP